MSPLTIRRLVPEDADAAFTLARLDDPSLTADEWRALVQDAPGVSGVLGAFAEGRVQGILRYSIVATPHGGSLFNIEALTAFDLFDPAPVAYALVQEAMTCARRDHSCERMGLSARLETAGRETVLRSIAGTASLHRVF